MQFNDAASVGLSSDADLVADSFAEASFCIADVWRVERRVVCVFRRCFFGRVYLEVCLVRLPRECFGFPDAEFAFDDFIGEPLSEFFFGAEDRSGVSGAEFSLSDEFTDVFCQAEQAKSVCDGDAASSDALCGFFVRHAVVFREVSVGFGFFQGVEVFSLDVFDERECEGFAVGDITNNHGDFFESGALCGAESSLASDEAEAVVVDGADDEGLNDAGLLNGLCELLEGLFLKVLSRLSRHGFNAVD